MKYWAFLLLFISLLLGATCNQKKELTFYEKMKLKWGDTIAKRFEKQLQPGAFTRGAHNIHKREGDPKANPPVKRNCGINGCHPGGDEGELPNIPNDCYTCHKKEDKVPFRPLTVNQ